MQFSLVSWFLLWCTTTALWDTESPNAARDQMNTGLYSPSAAESNLALIAKLNRQSASEWYGVGPWIGMNESVFRDRVLMRPRHKVDLMALKGGGLSDPLTDPPPSFDWRDHGAVTPVKDQGTAGTCWAFSTTGSIEGQWFLAGNTLTSLSEEYLVDCDHNDCGVYGGWPYLAYDFVINGTGALPSEAAYPYCSGSGDCFPCMASHNYSFCGPPPPYCNRTWDQTHCPPSDWIPAARISDWMPVSQNETLIEYALWNVGPLSVLFDATAGLQHYSGGVYVPSTGLAGCLQ